MLPQGGSVVPVAVMAAAFPAAILAAVAAAFFAALTAAVAAVVVIIVIVAVMMVLVLAAAAALPEPQDVQPTPEVAVAAAAGESAGASGFPGQAAQLTPQAAGALVVGVGQHVEPQIPDLQGLQLIQRGAGMAAAVVKIVEAAGEPGQEVAVLQDVLQGQLLQEEPRVAEAASAAVAPAAVAPTVTLVPPVVVPAGAVIVVPPVVVPAAVVGGAAAEGLQVQAAGIAAVGLVMAARVAAMTAGRRDQAGLAALTVAIPVEAIVHKDLPLLFVQSAERSIPHQQPMQGRKRGAKKDGGSSAVQWRTGITAAA